MGRLLAIALSATGLMALIAAVFAPKAEPAAAAAAVETPATKPERDSSESIELARGSSGQFHLTAEVNGQDSEFLIDTGADMVALTVAEAENLGLDFDPEMMEPMMQTASGTGRGTMVTIDTLVVAGREFHDVDAVVMEGLGVNLLGQSVLRRLGTVELRGDRMMIRPS